jgi:hypothetical protein
MKPSKSEPGEKKSDPKNRRNASPRKSIENRDLNTDKDQRTNASREEDWDVTKTSDNRSVNDTSIEQEEDREKRRKQEGSHPDEFL